MGYLLLSHFIFSEPIGARQWIGFGVLLAAAYIMCSYNNSIKSALTPDYKNDCLTVLGKKQAAKAAEHLKNFRIEQIFSSTKGRAMETAEYTAQVLGLDVIPCDFMRELSWGSLDGEPLLCDAHPWKLANYFAAEGIPQPDRDWREMEPYRQSAVVREVERVTAGFDAFLAELGYQREEDYYRVMGEDVDKKIAVFSHGGASSAVFSHLFNIPFPQVCAFLHLDYTSVTTVRLSNEKGALIYPKLIGSNDARHIEGVTVENVYGN